MANGFDDSIKFAKDRITSILGQTSPGFRDIGTAAGRAYVGGATYGEAIGKLRSGQLREAEALRGFLQTERQAQQFAEQMGLRRQTETRQAKQAEERLGLEKRRIGIAEERLGLEESKLQMDRLRQAAAQGERTSKSMLDAMELFMKGMSGESRNAYTQAVFDDPVSPRSPTEARALAAKHADLLQEAPVKESVKPLKVMDPDSPTGYSWRLGATGEMVPGAPAPSGETIEVGPKGGITIRRGAAATDLTKKEAQELRSIVREGEGTLTELNIAHEMLTTPAGEWGTGLKGVVSKWVGGPAAQLLGTDKAGVLWGPRVAEVAQVRTQLQSLIGRFIPTVTGDTSGRYSDRDMQRAEIALPAQDPKATTDEIMAAIETLRGIEQRAIIRSRLEIENPNDLANIRNPEGVERYTKELLDLNRGMKVDEAVRLAMRDIYGQ